MVTFGLVITLKRLEIANTDVCHLTNVLAISSEIFFLLVLLRLLPGVPDEFNYWV